MACHAAAIADVAAAQVGAAPSQRAKASSVPASAR